MTITITNLEEQAETLAKCLHEKQKYGRFRYEKHLEDVVKIARTANLRNDVICACWLHDTMEDCGLNYNEIKEQFSVEIAEMVYCVTDELGRNRKERKLKTYPKLAKNDDAVQVKLCDRIANMAQSLADKNKRLIGMYLEEHTDFKKHLYRLPSAKTKLLWDRIEELMTEAKKFQR